MSKRKRNKSWRIETVAIGLLVLCFFIWAITKIGLVSQVTEWIAPDEPEIVVAPIDSLKAQLDELRPVYVTIDNLKLRTEPTLKSSVLKKLPLHERVYFTGIMSDTTMRINIGRIIANEPWAKVIHEDGEEGWLYAAGLNFYKTENPNAVGSN